MKILIKLILITFGLFSCKKDIHCNCKITTERNDKTTIEYNYVSDMKISFR